MAPRYIEPPYDFMDRCWFTPQSNPRPVRTNGQGSIAPYPSTSSSAPRYKSHHREYQTFDPALKHLRDAYRCLPSLDYEYRAEPTPKAAAKHKGANGRVAGGQRVSTRAHLPTADDGHSSVATRGGSSRPPRRNRENIAALTARVEHMAPDYEYEPSTHAHTAPVHQAASKSKNASSQRSSRPTAPALDTGESYKERPGASWYRPAPPVATPSSSMQNDATAKEAKSWYRSRPQKVITPERPVHVLRRSKGKVARVSAVRLSLVAVTPTQRQEGGVKTWYAGVKRKLFRKVQEN